MALIGKEVEVRRESYYDNTITVWNEDKSDSWFFNKSDVVELTHVTHVNRWIGIGDEVSLYGTWIKVYGEHFHDGEWRLNCVKNDDFEKGCYVITEGDITDHKPLGVSHPTLSDQDLIKELERRNLIRDGKVLK